MKTYIGVDLGGTNVRVAKVDENGKILEVVKESTEIDQGVSHVMDKIVRMITSLDHWEECQGIGLGVPGPVDTQRGVMMLSTNLPGFSVLEIERLCSVDRIVKQPAFISVKCKTVSCILKHIIRLNRIFESSGLSYNRNCTISHGYKLCKSTWFKS